MKIQEIQKEIIDEFSFFDDWQQRYEYLIEIGKSLPALNKNEKKTTNLVKGCQSNVWLVSEYDGNQITYKADSDAILPKGIAGLLVRIYSHRTPTEILESNEAFIKEIGLQEFLSPTRANGLLAMIKQIKYYALAFSAKSQKSET